MTKEALHPHNEALQVIDRKLKTLLQTIDYMSSDGVEGSSGSKVFQKHYSEAINRVNQLNKTRNLLLKLDGGNTVDYVAPSEVKLKGSGKVVPVALVDDDGVILKKFKSTAEAERKTGISSDTIRYIANRAGEVKTVYKFIFL